MKTIAEWKKMMIASLKKKDLLPDDLQILWHGLQIISTNTNAARFLNEKEERDAFAAELAAKSEGESE